MQSKKEGYGVTIYGEVYGIYSRPVLAVLVRIPTSSQGLALEGIKVASAYAKTGTKNIAARENAQKIINWSKILYVDSNKKGTNT